MKLIKCYFCGTYFEEDEAMGWSICYSCALQEEREYEWYEDEREEYVLYDLDMEELNDKGISVKLAQYEEEL